MYFKAKQSVQKDIFELEVFAAWTGHLYECIAFTTIFIIISKQIVIACIKVVIGTNRIPKTKQ